TSPAAQAGMCLRFNAVVPAGWSLPGVASSSDAGDAAGWRVRQLDCPADGVLVCPVPCLLCGGADARRLFEKGGKTFFRCRGCGLEWIEPMPTPEEIGKYYEWAYREGIYAPYAEAEDIRQLIAEHRLDVVRRSARPGRWLDVGCATGHFVEAAVRAGMTAEGLDVSPGAIARARARGLTVHLARVEEFVPTDPYDTITVFDVIEHLLDPRAFLDRLHGWLRPGGTLVLTLPDVSSIYPRLLMRRHWFYYLPS